ncbi:hypothetical protein CC2G_010121 [Coprinopsis cinerea AmutBmut pab1-1]|nr:hypothetical protein CC2G_010121 [Coprinopsis cinerea AmutBmut pab1-1]
MTLPVFQVFKAGEVQRDRSTSLNALRGRRCLYPTLWSQALCHNCGGNSMEPAQGWQLLAPIEGIGPAVGRVAATFFHAVEDAAHYAAPAGALV